MESIGKMPMSHYKFHEAIGLVLIGPANAGQIEWPIRKGKRHLKQKQKQIKAHIENK